MSDDEKDDDEDCKLGDNAEIVAWEILWNKPCMELIGEEPVWTVESDWIIGAMMVRILEEITDASIIEVYK